jgi:hypothetical protein
VKDKLEKPGNRCKDTAQSGGKRELQNVPFGDLQRSSLMAIARSETGGEERPTAGKQSWMTTLR